MYVSVEHSAPVPHVSTPQRQNVAAIITIFCYQEIFLASEEGERCLRVIDFA